MNPFRMSKTGLTDRSKLLSRGHTTGCYTDINIQVPCGPGNQTGGQARDWGWRNKYFAPKLHHTHLQKLTHSNPPLPLPSPPSPTDGRYGAQGYEPLVEYQNKRKTIWRRTRRHRRIKTGIQTGKEIMVDNHIAYNPVTPIYITPMLAISN